MSTFSAADEYPKLLHEFELAEQRIAKLEAELAEEKFMREITDTGLCGAEEELKEIKAERDKLGKACRELLKFCAGVLQRDDRFFRVGDIRSILNKMEAALDDCQMNELGITEQDIADTMPPEPGR